MNSKRVTLADVARKAGVSQTAASFVLSGRKDMRISVHAEERVLRAAAETGYRPNIVSQSLRTGTTHTIGFVSDGVATTRFAGDFIKGALEAARERGNLLLIAETGGDPELERSVDRDDDRQAGRRNRARLDVHAEASRPGGLRYDPARSNALPERPSIVSSVVPNETEAGKNAAQILLDAGHREEI